MSVWPVPFLKGIDVYLLLCLLTYLTGLGLTRLIRARWEARAAALLAPVLGFAFWALVLGVVGARGIPVSRVAPLLGGVSLLLACLGLRDLFTRRTLLIGFCALLPLIAVRSSLKPGLQETPGGVLSDGFMYLTMAQYHWEKGRGGETEGAVAHQLAGQMNWARYTGTHLLAFFSCLDRPGDPAGMIVVFHAWGLFLLGCAVLGFWIAFFDAPGWGCLAAFVTCTGGWVASAAWLNNVDQLTTLCCMPALALAWRVAPVEDWRRGVVVGSLAAAALYQYVECLPFVLGGAGVILLPHLWRAGAGWRRLTIHGFRAVAVAALLVAPSADFFLNFFGEQWKALQREQGPDRPGAAYFHELLRPDWYPAVYWRLDGVRSYPEGPERYGAVGWVLSGLLAVGLARLARRGEWGLSVTACVLLAGAAYLLVRHQYPYAAYKLFSLGWWCVASAVVAGVGLLVERIATPRPRIALGSVFVLVLIFAGLRGAKIHRPCCPSERANVKLREFRRVRELTGVEGRPRLHLAARDVLANYLAIYHLRDQHLCCLNPNHVLAALLPQIGHDPDVEGSLCYFVTDDPGNGPHDMARVARLVRQAGPYKLWRLDEACPTAGLLVVHNRNGWENYGEGDTYWLGDGETLLWVYAPSDGTMRLTGDFDPGPLRPGEGYTTLTVTVAGGSTQSVRVGRQQQGIEFAVRRGINRVSLTALDPPTVPRSSIRDTRPLLVGMTGLSVVFTPTAAVLLVD